MSDMNPLNGTIHVKFGVPLSGNSRKNKCALNKNYVPIVAEVRSFTLNNINYQRKQFPGILAHAITIQGNPKETHAITC